MKQWWRRCGLVIGIVGLLGWQMMAETAWCHWSRPQAFAAEREAENLCEETEREAEKVCGETEREAEKAREETEREAERVCGETKREAESACGETKREEKIACVVTEYEVATRSDVGKTTESDVEKTTESDAGKATESDAGMEGVVQGSAVSENGEYRVGRQRDTWWSEWEGNTEFLGSGTEEEPFEIASLEDLMGLSYAVSHGMDYQGQYFLLTEDLELDDISCNDGNWMPIGWYQTQADMENGKVQAFRGYFDGGGHTIAGLTIHGTQDALKTLGLFGAVENGAIRHLMVEGAEVIGTENAAILVGSLQGSAVVYDVTVSGYVFAGRQAGGIAAEAVGTNADATVTIENCFADGIVLNSADTEGFVGGIAGSVSYVYLADNRVITQNGDANRIQGKGYVGGIAGGMKRSHIYNSYVNGTIGGNGTKAVGGMVGKYESGNLIMARMAGTISRTYNGSASREGTFVGMREGKHYFTYGTNRDSNLAYLFTDSASKAKQVFGSTIDGDNDYKRDAHIGYWTELEKKYVILEGTREYPMGERYFYEELEDGVKYIITQKMGKEWEPDAYLQGMPFCPDHFAPGYMGEPVRGYLIYIPRIDTRNANGTVDTDVAKLTAIPSTNSSYYRTIDKDHIAAVAPGVVVSVTTAANNTAQDRYQMQTETGTAGGVKPPEYRENGSMLPMSYQSNGVYSFVMPEEDTILNVDYIKLTTKLVIEPEETMIRVVQTRSGDRKNPHIVTEVKNAEGILIARYIDGMADAVVRVQPIIIHAEHNGTGEAANPTVLWTVDDENLLHNVSDTGYTFKDAAILPNLESFFIQSIISREVQAQAANEYRDAIKDTIYQKYAVLTAAANPDTSANGQAVYGNCRVGISFQIVDETTVRVEKLNLDRSEVEFTITRKLTGNRSAPKETYEISAPITVCASIIPQPSAVRRLTWEQSSQNGTWMQLEPCGMQEDACRISLKSSASLLEQPAWVQRIVQSDAEKKKENPLVRLEGCGSGEETILVTSEDQTNGRVTAECKVRIFFETIDESMIYASGGGNSSGGGGGISGSSAITAKDGIKKTIITDLPKYVVTGTWFQNASGKWLFADETRTYANEWAAIHNPYADASAGQSVYDWFRFDADGFMVTGWYDDADGNRYYLHTTSDGTLGAMYTGWHQVDGMDYYFNEESDGTRGALRMP